MTNRLQATEFAAIPAWALPTSAGHLSFFETIALAGLEGVEIRLSAADQRKLLGFPVFGKQAITVTADGTVLVSRSTCFGTDRETAEYSAERIERAATSRLRVSPGTFGPGYM
jgi:hypothetical protein